MPGFRQQAQDEILKVISQIDRSGHNTRLYEQKFKAMDDQQFAQLMDDLESGAQHLCIVWPNFSDVKLTVENNFAVADAMGHQFFQRVNMPARDGLPGYLTPIPSLVVPLPLRRQAQLLEKKISIPQDNNAVDDFTGQVTGASKGSKISFPEVQVVAAMGLDYSLTEMLKDRGGDEGAFNAMNAIIQRTGSVSLAETSKYASGVKAKQALATLLKGMMLGTTL